MSGCYSQQDVLDSIFRPGSRQYSYPATLGFMDDQDPAAVYLPPMSQGFFDYVPDPALDTGGPSASGERDLPMPWPRYLQGDASAYSGATQRTSQMAGRQIPQAGRPVAASRCPPPGFQHGAYPMGPPPPPPPPGLKTLPPTSTTFKHTPREPMGNLPMPKGEAAGQPRMSRFQFDSGRLAGQSGATFSSEEVERRRVIEERKMKQEIEALNFRNEGKWEAERQVRARMAAEAEIDEMAAEARFRARCKEEEEEDAVKERGTKEKKLKTGGGQDKVNHLESALKGLSIGGENGDEEEQDMEMDMDWDIVEGPNAEHVIVDECVDSDDSDTWC